MKKHIPNFITLLNLVSGFAATVAASRGSLITACFFIMAGMVFDFADGFSARMLKAYSSLGKDLDSLADMVTFGAAPGAILFYILSQNELSMIPAVLIAGLLPAASALRLAKFNNDSEQSTSFKGMATPASAFTVVSFIIASNYTDNMFFDRLVGSVWFAGCLSVFLAVMMNIKTRMFSLKFSHLRFSGNEDRYIFIVTSLLLLVLFRLASPPLIMLSYILISFVSAAFRRTATVS